MKYLIVAAAGLGLLASAAALAQDAKKAAPPAAPAVPGGNDLKKQASYSFGLAVGKQLKAQGAEIDVALFSSGLTDAMAGTPKMTDAQAQQTIEAFQKQVATQRGTAFLAANKAKPGVVTTPTGLQYKVLKEGTGPIPKATDTVATHYKGALIDGTEFDSSYKRGQASEFEVNGVIPGWTEALQKMKVGSKWQLVIPPELAYGASPPPGAPIPPYAVLVFEIELLKIK